MQEKEEKLPAKLIEVGGRKDKRSVNWQCWKTFKLGIELLIGVEGIGPVAMLFARGGAVICKRRSARFIVPRPLVPMRVILVWRIVMELITSIFPMLKITTMLHFSQPRPRPFELEA